MQALAVDKIVDRQTIKALDLEPKESAKLAGLIYVVPIVYKQHEKKLVVVFAMSIAMAIALPIRKS